MSIFALDALLGKGAYGHVWLSELSNNKKIAIKFLTALGAELNQVEFEQEVRMLSKLCHPNIGKILDYGVLPTPIKASATRHKYLEDTPYLVLEFIEGIPLHRLKNHLHWAQVYSIFEQILASLNHAHSKGILHQDIKSKNILVQLQQNNPPRVRLIDFGIATDLGKESQKETSRISGTPAYIPPEKWQMQTHIWGPWSDLYSCGIVLWDLLCGQRPFECTEYIEMMNAHLHQPLPVFSPTISCPASVEPFLRRLLSKDPFQRYVSARRALHDWYPLSKEAVLVQNDLESNVLSETQDKDSQIESNTLDVYSELIPFNDPMESSLILEQKSLSRHFPELYSFSDRDHQIDILDIDPPPDECSVVEEVPLSPLIQSICLPNDIVGIIDDSDFQETLNEISNYGVNLLRFRDTPLFGRKQEQQQALQILSQIHQHNKPLLLHVQGAKGVGTSRFSRWFSEFLVEHLSARAFRCSGDLQRDPLAQLLRSQLRASQRKDLVQTCYQYSPERLVIQIQQICDWLLDEQEHFSNNQQKYALVLDLIIQISQYQKEQNLPVLFIDHATPELLHFVQYLLTKGSGPLLIILTCYPETDEQRLAKIQEHQQYNKLNLSPLKAQEHKKILRYLLDCSDPMLKSIIRVSSGNPKISRQIIEDAIYDDQLEVSKQGLKIKNDVKLLYRYEEKEYWQLVLGRLIESHPQQLQALQLASILGFSFWRREWEEGISKLQLDPAPLIHWLIQRNLILITENVEECRFVNPVLYKILQKYLPSTQDWHHLNEISLQLIITKDSKKAIWRRGRYYSNLGNKEEALKHYIQSMYHPSYSSTRASRQEKQIAAFIDDHHIVSDSVGYVRFQRFLSYKARMRGDSEAFWLYNQWLLENTTTAELFYERGLAMHDAITAAKVFNCESISQIVQRIREAMRFAEQCGDPKLKELILRTQFDAGELSFEARRGIIVQAQHLLEQHCEMLSARAGWYWLRSASFLAMEHEDFDTVLEMAKQQHEQGKKNRDIPQLFSSYLHYVFYYVYTWQADLAVPWIKRADHLIPLLNPHHAINLLLVKLEHAYYSGQYQAAAQHYDEAIVQCNALKRHYLIPFLTLMHLKNYIVLRDYDTASKCFLQVVDLSAHQMVNAWFELARVSIELGHSRFAAALCTNIIQGFPQDKNPHFYQRALQLRTQYSLSTRRVFSDSPLRMIRSLFNDDV